MRRGRAVTLFVCAGAAWLWAEDCLRSPLRLSAEVAHEALVLRIERQPRLRIHLSVTPAGSEDVN